jgi:hypothetical protein
MPFVLLNQEGDGIQIALTLIALRFSATVIASFTYLPFGGWRTKRRYSSTSKVKPIGLV